ncbi:MAG TPA: hypothetical protein VKE69_11555 [Planctomycetota bacterium]|nr:hypothetical protein [Planctomycetota bacterium]
MRSTQRPTPRVFSDTKLLQALIPLALWIAGVIATSGVFRM